MESIGEFEYNTKDLIGHGAFAVVFKGRHKGKNSLVAIKSITKKNLAKSQNLLGKEIKILKELTELHHENVVALLDCKETAHHVYLVMEFCNGGDLADYLHAKGTLSEDTIRMFLRQIAGAMRALYAKGVVHRDLKPQNILLCHGAGRSNPSPSEIVLKIADFGFARFLQDGVMAATLCGSPMYMAPEVIMSLQYDAKADLWSIGTIVFQCLTGKAPFQAQTPQALKQYYEKNANLVPKIPSDTSSDLTNLLLRLLKRNAKDRMDFDEFFTHPFLKTIAKLSSPMPVPNRHRSVSSPLGSVSPSSPDGHSGGPLPSGTSPRLYSWGEAPQTVGPISTGNAAKAAAAASPPNHLFPAGGTLLKNSDNVRPQIGAMDGGLSSPDEQDFVFVPDCLGNDSPGVCDNQSPYSTNINPKTGGNNSPPRPTYLPGVPSQQSPKMRPHQASSKDQRSSRAPMTSDPVPVPTQRDTYDQIQRSLAHESMTLLANKDNKGYSSSPGNQAALPVSKSPKLLQESLSSSSLSSERSRGIPDLASISPPSVQFVIGTPPSGGRVRTLSGSSNGTPPNNQGILMAVGNPNAGAMVNPGYHLHQVGSANTAGFIRRNSLVKMNGNSSLSPILDFQQNNLLDEEDSDFLPPKPPAVGAMGTLNWSPEQEHLQHHFQHPQHPLEYKRSLSAYSTGTNLNQPNQGIHDQGGHPQGHQLPFQVAFGTARALTMPDMTQQYQTPNGYVPAGTSAPSAGAGTASNMIDSRDRRLFRQHNQSEGHLFLSSGASPPNLSSRCSSLPSNGGDGPFTFVAPELPEETLLEREHNETLAKLNFVLALVDCILDLAESKGNPLGVLTHTNATNRRGETKASRHCSNGPSDASQNNGPTSQPLLQQQQQSPNQQSPVGAAVASHSSSATTSESFRRAEQLVLYMRALQLLSSSLQLSRQEVQAGKLRPSSSVRNVLRTMKDRFHLCLSTCKALDSPTILQGIGVDPMASAATADRLLYDHAIEMCQSAALKELFGNPEECFHHYQTAQILLHSLAQQVHCEDDKRILTKYKDAVEKRLFVLQSQGFVCAYDTN